jgi:hypothetical protein
MNRFQIILLSPAVLLPEILPQLQATVETKNSPAAGALCQKYVLIYIF